MGQKILEERYEDEIKGKTGITERGVRVEKRKL